MAKLVIEGLTIKQAKTLAEWFEGEGEQDCSIWFEEHDVEAPYVNVHKKPWIFIEEDTVTISCEPHEDV